VDHADRTPVHHRTNAVPHLSFDSPLRCGRPIAWSGSGGAEIGQHGQHPAHPALIPKIIGGQGGRTPAPPVGGPSERLPEPLSQAETRVLRLLQTSLSAPEIARELYVSVNTVRTHMRHLYDKLGAHRRLEALDRARALGILAPVPQRA
jgi:DNA-binding CsgD family transcriptional regulator